ncbi:hypothetical protein PXK00_03160 [Phaeobacter sp. QD34_3]|uniref:hypothetical protein n=1 Tax=unclassified Phaeobacter TaxID=2621772 RepID=UPI00237FAE3A|nr:MULTISPECIES: hypothetical protein [unclassified Phaeobacter]MDE4132093.1 hypothetical protein [Phaeobacter sp. QD34_3]MDE4135731.1 hypothetical protein [Phaeobacter sp. QD34_24]MDE4172654.1 hypothetical protein [Phaeobacter sp. PT47_59]
MLTKQMVAVAAHHKPRDESFLEFLHANQDKACLHATSKRHGDKSLHAVTDDHFALTGNSVNPPAPHARSGRSAKVRRTGFSSQFP